MPPRTNFREKISGIAPQGGKLALRNAEHISLRLGCLVGRRVLYINEAHFYTGPYFVCQFVHFVPSNRTNIGSLFSALSNIFDGHSALSIPGLRSLRGFDAGHLSSF